MSWKNNLWFSYFQAITLIKFLIFQLENQDVLLAIYFNINGLYFYYLLFI